MTMHILWLRRWRGRAEICADKPRCEDERRRTKTLGARRRSALGVTRCRSALGVARRHLVSLGDASLGARRSVLGVAQRRSASLWVAQRRSAFGVSRRSASLVARRIVASPKPETEIPSNGENDDKPLEPFPALESPYNSKGHEADESRTRASQLGGWQRKLNPTKGRRRLASLGPSRCGSRRQGLTPLEHSPYFIVSRAHTLCLRSCKSVVGWTPCAACATSGVLAARRGTLLEQSRVHAARAGLASRWRGWCCVECACSRT